MSAGVSTTTLWHASWSLVFTVRIQSLTSIEMMMVVIWDPPQETDWKPDTHMYFEGNTPTLLIATRLHSGNTHSCEKTTMNSWVMSARVVNDIQDKSESSWDDLSSFLILLCQQSRIC